MKRNYFKAFTLVELIIVITIMAILATIAFMSFQNYYNTTRDSVRVSDIKIIYDGLSVYKIKTGKYPLPDAFVDISGGIQKLTHQGEIGKNIKSIISVNGKANDPKDHTNYIYAIDVKNQKGQLMAYLEKGTDIRHLSLLPQMYASSTDYTERPVYIYGDKLGIITDENKTPIQYTTGTGVNLLDDEYAEKELNTYIGGDAGDGGKTTATGTVLVTQIESSLSGSLSCGTRSYNGYTLSGLAHDETGTFTKVNPISEGTQHLELTIKCINGEYDTTNAVETITSVDCTTSNYVPHNNSCVENKCSGSIPDNAHSTALTQNHLTSWTYNEPNSLCSFECDLNYTYDVGSNTCKANSRTESCSSIPNNASYNSVDTISQTWSGGVWLPSNTSIHEPTASTSECRFTCNAGYTYDLGSNTCVGNSCTIPATESYNSKTYTIASPGTLVHNNSVTRSGTTSFGVSPTSGTMTADFVYTCNAGVLSKTVSNTGGSCSSGYSFNNNYTTPACNGNSCTTPTSAVHSTLTYSLTSQSVAHGGSVTITSANRAFGTSPANGTTSAKFTYSCNAGAITLTSTANNAGTCGTGYSFNNNYSAPACSAIIHAVSFNSNGGTIIPNLNINYNSTITQPTNPTKLGYTFTGWYKEAGLINLWNFGNDKVTGDIVLYAKWVANNNTITFHGNGNTGGSTGPQTLATAATAALTANGFTKTGYTFAGWATSAGGAVVYANSANYTMGTSDVTLYAVWVGIQYTVSFNVNDGAGSQTNITATYGASMPSIIVGLNKVGFDFTGYWDAISGGNKYYDSNGISAKNWDKTVNTTLYAQWSPKNYTIYLDNNGGSGYQGSTTIKYNSPMPKLTIYVNRTGYSFAGFYDMNNGGTKYYNSDGTSAKNWDKTMNTTLYAIRIPLGFKDLGGGYRTISTLATGSWCNNNLVLFGTTYDKSKCILYISGPNIYAAPTNSISSGYHWNSNETSCTDGNSTCDNIKNFNAGSMLSSSTSGYAIDYCNQLNTNRYGKNIPLVNGTNKWYLPPPGTNGFSDLKTHENKLNISSLSWYWASRFRGTIGTWDIESLGSGMGSVSGYSRNSSRSIICITK